VTLDEAIDLLAEVAGCGCCGTTSQVVRLLPDDCPRDPDDPDDTWHKYGEGCHASNRGATRAVLLAWRGDDE